MLGTHLQPVMTTYLLITMIFAPKHYLSMFSDHNIVAIVRKTTSQKAGPKVLYKSIRGHIQGFAKIILLEI